MLLFDGPDGQSLIQPKSLIVTIDESGEEGLTDPQYPVFGLGACAILARDYADRLALPWLALKKRHFGGDSRAELHAADLRSPSPDQIAALTEYFRVGPFARLGAFLTGESVLNGPFTRYAAVAQVLVRQLARVARVVPCDSITLLVESSPKYDGTFHRLFSTMKVVVEEGGAARELPVELFRSSKNPLVPSLEVADFIAHTAGTATRATLRGHTAGARRDMAVVFGLPEPMSQYMRIDRIERGQVPVVPQEPRSS